MVCLLHVVGVWLVLSWLRSPNVQIKKRYLHHTNTTCKIVILKSPPRFLENRDEMLWWRDFVGWEPRSELVKFHNASVRHIKPSAPADFSVDFSGSEMGRCARWGSRFLAVFARSNLALIPDEEKQKKKKKKVVLWWSEISLFLKMFFLVLGNLVGFHVGECVVGGGPTLWRYCWWRKNPAPPGM